LEQNSKKDETATVSKQEIKKLIAEAIREFGSNLIKE
jgi:hypothetical protein